MLSPYITDTLRRNDSPTCHFLDEYIDIFNANTLSQHPDSEINIETTAAFTSTEPTSFILLYFLITFSIIIIIDFSITPCYKVLSQQTIKLSKDTTRTQIRTLLIVEQLTHEPKKIRKMDAEWKKQTKHLTVGSNLSFRRTNRQCGWEKILNWKTLDWSSTSWNKDFYPQRGPAVHCRASWRRQTTAWSTINPRCLHRRSRETSLSWGCSCRRLVRIWGRAQPNSEDGTEPQQHKKVAGTSRSDTGRPSGFFPVT